MNNQELIEKFHAYLLTEKRVSSNTFIAYKTDIKQFADFLHQEQVDLQALKADTIKLFLHKLKQQKMSARTMSRKISCLKAFFNYLHEYNNIENSGLTLSFPRLEKKLPNYLAENEVEILLQVSGSDESPAGIRNKVMLYLLYATGMRISELVQLKVSDIHFDTGFITVNGKGEKSRMIPLPALICTLLTGYLEATRRHFIRKEQDCNYVFLSYYKKQSRSITRQAFWVILKNLWKKTQIKRSISPHTLRHSFATHMLKNGAHLRSLQLLLGHENLSTVQVYTHVETSHLRHVYDKKHPRS